MRERAKDPAARVAAVGAAFLAALALAASAAARALDPVADLAVTGTVSAATALVGDTVTYTLTVANNGDELATGAVFKIELSKEGAFASATASGGRACTISSSKRHVRCSLGRLSGGGDSVQIVATATAAGSGALTAVTDALAKQPDPDTANQQLTLRTDVTEMQPSPPCAMTPKAVMSSPESWMKSAPR